jgi:hypothetical protein
MASRWFKLSGFIIFAVLVYIAFFVSDWISKAVGLSNYGIVGTLVILALPVFIIYWIMKRYLRSQI